MAIRGGGRVLRARMQKDDVIVAGWMVGFTLSQFFDHPEDRILLPNKYVSKVSNKLDAPASGRVFYVTGRTGLLPPFTPAEAAEMSRRFGRDQIVIGPSDDSGPGASRGREARIQDFGQVEVTVYRGDTTWARCSKNGVKIYCVERRGVSTHLFRGIINYWRCWKNSYRLVSWQIIGACSPNVAVLKIRLCVVFRAIYKRMAQSVAFP